MATRVIYANDTRRAASTGNATWADAYAMTGPAVLQGGNLFGADFGASVYATYNAYLYFITEGLQGVSAATLQSFFTTTGSGSSGKVFDALIGDWNLPFDAGQVVGGATLAGYTKVAQYTSPGNGTAINAFTNWTDVAMVANLGSSTTEIILAGHDHVTNTAPGGANQYMSVTAGTGDSRNYRLSVVDTSTQSSQTINAGTTTFTPTVTGLHDVESWGGGGCPAQSTSQENGSAGGTYTLAHVSVTSLSAVTVSIAAAQTGRGSNGNDTYWNTNAAGFPGAVGGNAGAGVASVSNDRGSVAYTNGTGATAQGGGGSRAGSGGGSSAGTAANGNNGAAGVGTTVGTGGSAPTGGGAGGNGGASGAAGASGSAPGGGAGGAGNGQTSTGQGAAGKMIVYWYVYPAGKALPPIQPNPFLPFLVR